MAANDGNILMEGATVMFRNFAGREGQFNAEGDRNFCVALDDDLAKELIADGWNIKELRAREEGDTPQKYLQVSVKYHGRTGAKVRPPAIVLITSRGRTPIDEDTVSILDQVDIANVDLIIRPHEWAVNGKSGVKAYLKSLYLTMAEDQLALKYRDVPEIGAGSNQTAIGTGDDDNVIDVDWYEPDEQKAITR